jgi:hypothetical protein
MRISFVFATSRSNCCCEKEGQEAATQASRVVLNADKSGYLPKAYLILSPHYHLFRPRPVTSIKLTFVARYISRRKGLLNVNLVILPSFLCKISSTSFLTTGTSWQLCWEQPVEAI